MNYRVADERDIPVLCQIRKQQLIDEGSDPGINIDEELPLFPARQISWDRTPQNW